MTNIASALKAEIQRISRKEIRDEIMPLKKAIATYRSEIAALKRRAAESEKSLRGVDKRLPTKKVLVQAKAAAGVKRFSAKGLTSLRKRLGLSAADVGLLLGASGQSVYNWEAGTTRPRDSHLSTLSVLRHMTKNDAATQLEAMRSTK